MKRLWVHVVTIECYCSTPPIAAFLDYRPTCSLVHRNIDMTEWHVPQQNHWARRKSGLNSYYDENV